MHQNKYKNKNQAKTKHLPVLLDEVLRYLDPQTGETYLDLTAGYGGHAAAILKRTGNYSGSTLVDRDTQATTQLSEQFGKKGSHLCRQDFLSASQELVEAGQQFDLILADLGVSSPHLNEQNRGFSLQASGPLDMRMDQSQELTAETVVNSYDESTLADLLWRYGEEPKARQIAHDIVHSRPLHTTDQLAAIAAKGWKGHSRLHPATRTFQAIRIAVNDELQQLELSLPLWIRLMSPGGRLAIISFHSLEDRLVKQALQAASGDRYDAELLLLTKRPIKVASHELDLNPRARSAKLRAAVKINTQEGNSYANPGKK